MDWVDGERGGEGRGERKRKPKIACCNRVFFVVIFMIEIVIVSSLRFFFIVPFSFYSLGKAEARAKHPMASAKLFYNLE